MPARRLALWLILPLIISACAPLSPHDTALGDIAEVAGRVVACPLTLCMSELGLRAEADRARRQAAHDRWYWSASREERARADRREQAALIGLGMALSGGGPFQARPSYSAPLAPPCHTMIGNQIGSATYLNCY